MYSESICSTEGFQKDLRETFVTEEMAQTLDSLRPAILSDILHKGELSSTFWTSREPGATNHKDQEQQIGYFVLMAIKDLLVNTRYSNNEEFRCIAKDICGTLEEKERSETFTRMDFGTSLASTLLISLWPEARIQELPYEEYFGRMSCTARISENEGPITFLVDPDFVLNPVVNLVGALNYARNGMTALTPRFLNATELNTANSLLSSIAPTPSNE